MSAPSADALRARDVNVRTTPLTCGCQASVATRIRIEVSSFVILNSTSLPNQGGEFRCPVCGEVLEAFNGDEAFVTHRLTVPPQKKRPGATAAPGKSGAAGPKGSEDLASKK